MALAIILGALSGVAAFLPLYGGLKLVRRAAGKEGASEAVILVLAFVLSLVVLMVTAILCWVFAEDLLVPFGLAEAIALCVSAIVYGVWKMVIS